jgi:hypothetical protein
VRRNSGPWCAFTPEWFVRWQRPLLWALNAPYVRRWARWVLRIHRDVPPAEAICGLLPHAVWWGHRLEWRGGRLRARYTIDVRTHDKFAKRLYWAFRPLWWILHAWDSTVAQPYRPAWDAGFDTLTRYPDAHPETTTVDGYAYHDTGLAGSGVVWATLVAAAGTFASDATATGAVANIQSDTGANKWLLLTRSFFLFNTAAIGVSSSIESAVLQVHGSTKTDSFSPKIAPNTAIYAGTPASNTALVAGDFDAVGSTIFSGNLAHADFAIDAYNSYVFNAAGLDAIDKAGISKFSGRSRYDANPSTPVWSAGHNASVSCKMADTAGVTTDPRLVVEYTLGVPGPGSSDDLDMIAVPRQRGITTIIHFPLRNTNRALVTGATGLDSEIEHYSDGAAPDGWADCTNEAVEIGSTGWYRLTLTAAEMDAAYHTVRVKSNEALEQPIHIYCTGTNLINPQGVLKNTALANFLFMMYDVNGDPSPGLSVTATRSIDGAAFGACANSVAEVASGWYKIDLAAADLNGDTVALHFAAAGSKTTDITLITVKL